MARGGRRLFSVVLCWIVLAGGMASSQPHHGAAGFAVRSASLTNVQDLDQLRDLFNQRAGVPRLILLLSPTCTTCIAGASWVQQNILDAHPAADLHVYAIWMPILPTDKRSRWDDGLLNDPRVTHL